MTHISFNSSSCSFLVCFLQVRECVYHVWYHACIPTDWNRNGPLFWHSLNLLILRWHVSTYPETWITHQWALMPDPGWLLSLRTNKHVTTNTSVDQTSDELEMVSVYAVRERNDALRLFTADVEKHVINQSCYYLLKRAHCSVRLITARPLSGRWTEVALDLFGNREVTAVPGNLVVLESVFDSSLDTLYCFFFVFIWYRGPSGWMQKLYTISGFREGKHPYHYCSCSRLVI